MIRTELSLVTLAALAMGAIDSPAQELSSAAFQPRDDAGFMHIRRSFNATALTVLPGIDCNAEDKACALTSAIWHKGRFWVLGREGWCCALSLAVSEKTFIHEWTADGTYVKTTEVPLPADADDREREGLAPEVRDMATDEWRFDAGEWVASGGQAVFMGTEEGIYVTHVDGAGAWHLWDEIETANGTKTVGSGDFVNPIRGPGLAVLRANGTPEMPNLDPATGLPFADTMNGEGEGYMAVAFDPAGNGGDGSFWVGADDGDLETKDGMVRIGDPRGWDDPTDPATQRETFVWIPRGDTPDWDGIRGGNTKPIVEIDLMGNILTTLHNGTLVTDVNDPLYTHWDPTGNGDAVHDPGEKDANPANDGLLSTGGEWCAGGLELDPFTGNLWVQVNMEHQVFELDTATGDATGYRRDMFDPDRSRAGGLTGVPRGDPGSSAGFWDLIVFSNVPGDDFFSVHRGHPYPGFDGLSEPRLLTTVNPKLGPATSTPIRRDSTLHYTQDQNIDLLIDETAQGSAGTATRPDAGLFPAVVIFDIDAATDTDGSTDLSLFGLPGLLPELNVHSNLSAPDPLNAGLAPTFTVPYLLSFTMPTDTVVSFPAPSFVPTGQKIRMQAVYYDSRSQYGPGLMATNEAWMSGVGTNQVLIEAVGENSFSVHPDGFFRIHYLGGPPIEVVKLDFRASSNLNNRFAWFDMDQPGMADWMGVGRAWDGVSVDAIGNPVLVDLPGCDDSFRQDSDITTGLVYATTYDYPAPLDTGNPVPQYVPGSYLFTSFNSPACDYYTDELGYQLFSGLTGTPDDSGIVSFLDDLTDMVFQFTDFDDEGDALRFDCDTDRFRLTVPDAEFHAGLAVTVVQADGNVFTGELVPDPNGGRSFIGW